jgi:hypothetical protein
LDLPALTADTLLAISIEEKASPYAILLDSELQQVVLILFKSVLALPSRLHDSPQTIAPESVMRSACRERLADKFFDIFVVEDQRIVETVGSDRRERRDHTILSI